jgi:hypothetical protein
MNDLPRLSDTVADRVLDPPTRVSAEAGAVRGIEAVDGAEKSKIAFRDQIRHAKSASHEPACDADHEAEIGAGEAVTA